MDECGETLFIKYIRAVTRANSQQAQDIQKLEPEKREEAGIKLPPAEDLWVIYSCPDRVS